MKMALEGLQKEVERFDAIQAVTSKTLSSTIDQLENIHDQYKIRPPTCKSEQCKLKSVRFNLRKRHDLTNDFLSLCQSASQRTDRVKELKDELKSLNDYATQLFTGIETVLAE